ncbi:nitroreductase [Candidatus Bathyarchaeota archaeon]|nr:nitroreductase [Candidatus Bathyarchaeota archaeon]
MQFQELIEKRRSIRKYKPTPIPRAKILKLLEAARIAPSASNRQPWHFIVVEDKDMITKLAKQPWAASAPAMIVGLADTEESPGWCVNDFGIAFEHLVLAAADLGLGACWMGQSNREDLVRELLDIPEKYKVVAIATLGEADEAPPAKQRKLLESIVSWEKYGKTS